ncbi:GFA family protein [Ensifer sp. ENS12]|uniref:GFA family protein n=1 Tax=Ensifer sp. ENS12 TaxID=2854774 RepID=UPI000DE57DD5|nr:GFA family protein [Ensifer sp. ENS12]MBV7518113.1 GFA family protein [Ensifer sp. ENS12]
MSTVASGKKKPLFTGGCLCGAIRFEAKGAPRKPHTCSCMTCQRHSGALTLAWVEFDKDVIAWTGPGGTPSVYRSSDYSSRAFCPACGSSIGAIDDAPVVALLLGILDKTNSADLIPAVHSYRSARPKWWHVEAVKPAT